jgi:FdrA protein
VVVLLLDVVLGYGAHADPASEVAQAVTDMRAARAEDAPIVVIATVTGTSDDPQDLGEQIQKLESAGIVVAQSVRSAVLLATQAIAIPTAATGVLPALLSQTPAIVNIGLRSFADDLHSGGAKVIQEQWAPPAGGNERMQQLLALLT